MRVLYSRVAPEPHWTCLHRFLSQKPKVVWSCSSTSCWGSIIRALFWQDLLQPHFWMCGRCHLAALLPDDLQSRSCVFSLPSLTPTQTQTPAAPAAWRGPPQSIYWALPLVYVPAMLPPSGEERREEWRTCEIEDVRDEMRPYSWLRPSGLSLCSLTISSFFIHCPGTSCLLFLVVFDNLLHVFLLIWPGATLKAAHAVSFLWTCRFKWHPLFLGQNPKLQRLSTVVWGVKRVHRLYFVPMLLWAQS